MIRNILMLFVMTFSGTLGALFFKRASASLDPHRPYKVLLNVSLYLGGCFYLLGAALNIVLLGWFDYSVLYPMTSLTYIWTAIVSYFVYKEKITKYKIIALILIAAGIILISA